MCFINEVIKNRAIRRCFYEIFEGVEDFVRLIFKKKIDSIKKCNSQLSIIYQCFSMVKFHQRLKVKKFDMLETD